MIRNTGSPEDLFKSKRSKASNPIFYVKQLHCSKNGLLPGFWDCGFTVSRD